MWGGRKTRAESQRSTALLKHGSARSDLKADATYIYKSLRVDSMKDELCFCL